MNDVLEIILRVFVFSINTVVVLLVLYLVSKWHRRMEDKLDDIKEYIKHVTDRNDIVFINQLEEMKRRMIKYERYEDAKKIDECIKKEYKNLGIK